MSVGARRVLLALPLAAGLLGGGARPAGAQGARITGVTSVGFVELRPLVDDSVPLSSTVDSSGILHITADGTVVICAPSTGICRYKRPGGSETAVPFTQDLHVTAWGLGTGVSAVADVRLRAVAGERELWPRSTDAFDVLEAYVQLDRWGVRTRAGRQWATTSLDTRNFDGLSLEAAPMRGLVIDAWGGLSLAPALNETHLSDEIAAVDELPPDERAWRFGATARVATPLRGAFAAGYERSIRTDLAALYGERLSAAWTASLWRGGLDASWAADLAAGQTNELRLRLRSPPLGGGVLRGTTLSIEGRRYRPYFELWSIWGAFSPVGYSEAQARASWDDRRVAVNLFGAYRDYADPEAGFPGEPMLGHGWRVGGDGATRFAPSWVATGRYALDIGFGASGSDGDVGLRWDPGHGRFLGVHVAAFQLIPELSVGTGFMWGGGLDGGLRLGPDTRVVADVALYRQGGHDAGARRSDWSQHRASVRFEWGLGGDPGLPGRRR